MLLVKWAFNAMGMPVTHTVTLETMHNVPGGVGRALVSRSTWDVGIIQIQTKQSVGRSVATIAHELMHLVVALLPGADVKRALGCCAACEEVLCEAVAACVLRTIVEDREMTNRSHDDLDLPLREARATLARYARDPRVSVDRVDDALREILRAYPSSLLDVACARIMEEVRHVMAAPSRAPLRGEVNGGLRTMVVGNHVVTFGQRGQPREYDPRVPRR